ncbi:MAG: transglycosylase SLT domain-containing protein [Ignisphaera sp.]|nr:transglycosylase SLT domain-containing protein [Ignisphaera sp.]
MGNTFSFDVQEVQDRKAGKLRPATTRGLVVSNVDPLYAGRVKVWIPALHGSNPYGESGLDEPQATELVPGVKRPGDFKSQATKDGLPWAKVLSHNLGPMIDLNTGVSTPAGVFTTPSVGTEVMLIFENNDPHFPVIIGSIIHANEFRYSLARPLEYLPGVQLSEPSQIDSDTDKAAATPKVLDQYEKLVSTAYNVRTASGNTLFMSDDPTNRTIVLEGAVAFSEVSTLLPQEEINLGKFYPAFPTTSTAAYAKRQLLTVDSTTPIVSPSPPGSVPNPSNTSITTTVNVQSPNSEAVEQTKTAQASSGVVEKGYPVSGSPRWSTGIGRFGIQRPPNIGGGQIHVGIDIGANADGSTILLAPIDLYPLWHDPSSPAGQLLICLGTDGFAHTFMHERLIYPNIAEVCEPLGNPANQKLIKKGTPLGICGITQKSSRNTGPHLHWEVFNAGDAKTGTAIRNRRNQLKKQSPIPSGMVNPMDWLKNTNGSTTLSAVTVTPTQMSQYIEQATLVSKSAEAEYAKPAGLEMSLTPGKETIMLRHPSGSFIGFDPDGNILIYSCGDVNFRVNRSITYDIFGAIMENAFAKFSRIKTVAKRWARIHTNVKDLTKADNTMPEFYTRVEKTREADMQNAVTSNLGNSFIIDSNKNLVDPNTISINPPSNQTDSTGMYVTKPASKVAKNFTLTKWDDIIKEMYKKYITPNPTALIAFPDVTDFKALMLHESDGNEKARSTASAIGLFQLKPIAFEDVLNYKLTETELSQYYDGVKNTEIAFKFMVKNVEYVRSALSKIGVPAQDIGAVDYKYLTFLTYNQGSGRIAELIKAVKSNGQAITYKNVENFAIVSRKLSKEGLLYVPTIEYIKSQTPKLS